MPFRAISGKFHCVNYSPDGDTLRFGPDDLADLAFLSGVPAKVNGRGHASLRLEGIDALETHFEGRHQPLALANQARNAVLTFLGIQNVQWDSGQSSVVSATDGVAGYILARSTDKFGRIIAFAFPGAWTGPTGTAVFVEPATLDPSANCFLLQNGLAYPTFYWTLFADLRMHLTGIVNSARQAFTGIHAVDQTNALFTVANIGSLTDDLVIMPKLFRRASTYLASTGSIAGFKAALAANQEPVLDLQTANITHFDTFIEEQGNQIRLTRKPEELVFDPMPERPGGEFSVMVDNIRI